MKKLLKRYVQRWQYNPYGSRRHNFAFYWLTGHSFKDSLKAGIRRPYRRLKRIN